MKKNFTPNKSKSDSDVAEKSSIRCLEEILNHDEIQTYLTVNDKTPNIDGYIELLDKRLPIGKITVQVKTYPKKYNGESKFDFPTSIFGYAQHCITEFVFLIAVNKRENVAYWKYINNELIIQYQEKTNQSKITIGFDKSEILSNENIDETIEYWKSLFKAKYDLIIQSSETAREKIELITLLEKYRNPTLSFAKKYIISIQKFIDTYNFYLDSEYNSIKKYYYPNTWKIGIALFECTDDKISYIIYKIREGENDLLIREIPSDKVKEFTNYVEISSHYSENVIYDNPDGYAFKLIQKKTLELLENKSILFLTQEIASEYIFDFIKREGHYIDIKQKDTYYLKELKELFERKYNEIQTGISYNLVKGNHEINLNIFYSCVCFLIKNKITNLDKIYPLKGKYSNTGFVSDSYTAELAFEKLKYFYERIPILFESYMDSMFPSLKNEITFFDGYDLILVDLKYRDFNRDTYGENHQINLYYLKQTKGIKLNQKIIASLNQDANIYRENNIDDTNPIERYFGFNQKIIYHGNEYGIFKMSGEEMSLFFKDYYIHNMLYKYLNDQFNGYYKK